MDRWELWNAERSEFLCKFEHRKELLIIYLLFVVPVVNHLFENLANDGEEEEEQNPPPNFLRHGIDLIGGKKFRWAASLEQILQNCF